MHQKLRDVAGYALGANITAVDTLYFFPLETRTASIFGGESFPACGTVDNIPAHLHGIRRAGLFQAFIEKYSEYPITLSLQDEQGSRPPFHYGFSAVSGDGNFASIYFHADTCTGEITDLHKYQLICDYTQGYYPFYSGNPRDTAASMALDEFCIIPVELWRQSFCDYAVEASEESYLRREGGMLGRLQGLYGVFARGRKTGHVGDPDTHDRIRQLCRRCHLRRDPRVPRRARCPPG